MTPVRHALGIDIGGTKISAAIVGEDDTAAVYPHTVPTPATEGPDAILDAAAALAVRVMAESGIAPAAFGAGSAGAFDLSGTVVNSTDHLRGWLGAKVADGLSARLGATVTVLNDVHAAALGELDSVPDTRTDSLLFVAVGTGIGGAIVSRGRVVRGVSGMAGSVGHVRVLASRLRTCSCGGRDHVEAFASGPAMERSYRELSGIDAGLADIGERARNGDAVASRVIGDAARLLAGALAGAVAVTDVGEIVLGGGVTGLGDLFVSPLVSGLRAELHPLFAGVELRVSSLGTTAAVVGSARAAFRVLDGASVAELFA